MTTKTKQRTPKRTRTTSKTSSSRPKTPVPAGMIRLMYDLENLQEVQHKFATANAIFRLMGGAKGGGKSFACRAEAVRQCLTRPNIRGLILRRTFPEVEENVVNKMRQEMPKTLYTYNGTKHIMTFNNHPDKNLRSEIVFGYCQTFNDVFRYQGQEYDFICIEELTQRTQEEFEIIMTSMRTSKKGVTPNFFGSTNPGGIGHGRVKRLWIDRQFTEDEDPNDYFFQPASIYDNPILMENDPNYLKTLKKLPEKYRRAYLEGDWDGFSGQFFTEFRRSIHVINPSQRPTKPMVKRAGIALDYGFAAPSAVLRGEKDTQGNIYIYRELYRPGLVYSKLGMSIKAMTMEDEQINFMVGDPAAVNKKSESDTTTMKKEFGKLGLHIKPAKNSRISGWNLIRELLKPYTDPNTKEKTAKLKICSNCENLIRTLPLLVHDKRHVEDVDTKGEDHGPDALRYLLAELADISTMSEVKAANDDMKTVKRITDATHAAQGNIASKRF